jgi:hypothetical protein
VVDPNTGGRTPLQAFSFEPNSNTSNGLAMGSGSSSPPDSNPLFGGSAWFGFASRVEPFVPPMLGPDQFLAFQFTVEVDESLLPLSLAAQFAGGEGMGDGAPDFGGAHPVRYFTAANQSVSFTAPSEPVPALSAAAAVLAILSLGAVGFGSFRRLLAKGKPDYRETNSA